MLQNSSPRSSAPRPEDRVLDAMLARESAQNRSRSRSPRSTLTQTPRKSEFSMNDHGSPTQTPNRGRPVFSMNQHTPGRGVVGTGPFLSPGLSNNNNAAGKAARRSPVPALKRATLSTPVASIPLSPKTLGPVFSPRRSSPRPSATLDVATPRGRPSSGRLSAEAQERRSSWSADSASGRASAASRSGMPGGSARGSMVSPRVLSPRESSGPKNRESFPRISERARSSGRKPREMGVSVLRLERQRTSQGERTPRISPRESALVSPRFGFVSGKENDATTIWESDPHGRRQKMRESVQQALDESETETERRVVVLLRRGLDRAAVAALRRMTIGEGILQRTQVAKKLKDARLPGADSLLECWRRRVRHCVRLGFEIEQIVFERYAVLENGASERAITKQNHGTWSYAQDCRNLVSILKKPYNAEVKARLLRGTLSASKFLADFEHDPQVYDSPQVKQLRKSAELESDRMAGNVEADFPFTDLSLVCPKCGDTGKGCRYAITFYDSWASWRSDKAQSIMARCPQCKYQWLKQE